MIEPDTGEEKAKTGRSRMILGFVPFSGFGIKSAGFYRIGAFLGKPRFSFKPRAA